MCFLIEVTVTQLTVFSVNLQSSVQNVMIKNVFLTLS